MVKPARGSVMTNSRTTRDGISELLFELRLLSFRRVAAAAAAAADVVPVLG